MEAYHLVALQAELAAPLYDGLTCAAAYALFVPPETAGLSPEAVAAVQQQGPSHYEARLSTLAFVSAAQEAAYQAQPKSAPARRCVVDAATAARFPTGIPGFPNFSSKFHAAFVQAWVAVRGEPLGEHG